MEICDQCFYNTWPVTRRNDMLCFADQFSILFFFIQLTTIVKLLWARYFVQSNHKLPIGQARIPEFCSGSLVTERSSVFLLLTPNQYKLSMVRIEVVPTAMILLSSFE